MPKRLTSIRLGEITDQQIKDFTDLGYTVTQLIAMAIDCFYHKEIKKEQDTSLYAPIYNQIFHICSENDKETIQVKSGGEKLFLSQINFRELELDEPFYIEIGHLLRPPFARVDFEETGQVKGNSSLRKFCRGMIVATPSFSVV